MQTTRCFSHKIQEGGRQNSNASTNAATTIGLHTLWMKTKLQNIGHGPPPQSVSVDGHLVEVTDQFVYLDSNVDSNGYSSTDILRPLGLASSVMGQLDRV